jgi:hypothetical protein
MMRAGRRRCETISSQGGTRDHTDHDTGAPPDPMKLLERAMGMDLEEAAKLALACAQRGLPGGRPGKHYSSPYEAAIDNTLGDVEQSLVEQRAALSRAQSTTSTNLAKAIPGSNVPAQAVAEIAARVDKLEHRRLILAALMPLGRRAALLSRLADCEAESAELRGQSPSTAVMARRPSTSRGSSGRIQSAPRDRRRARRGPTRTRRCWTRPGALRRIDGQRNTPSTNGVAPIATSPPHCAPIARQRERRRRNRAPGSSDDEKHRKR